jgi:deoxyribonuclease-4
MAPSVPKARASAASRCHGPGGPLGFHVAIAGGLVKAPAHARLLGARAMQIFTRSPRMWRGPAIAPETAAAFREALPREGIAAIVAHAGYLLNLASAREDLRRKSVATFIEEIEACALLGVPAIVLHPGSGGDSPKPEALRRLAKSLDEALKRAPGDVTVLLESMAGGGGQVGGSFDELAWLIEHGKTPERLGVCLDSCHLFAAGWPLHEPDGLDRVLAEAERTVGLAKVGCWHLNDSLGEVGRHRDRHARIGKGRIGKEFFRRLLHEPRQFGVPKILEVPGGDAAFAGDLRLLARLAPRA